MKRSLKIPLLAVSILAVSLPAGFAVAQVVESGGEADRPPIDRRDPDPNTNAKEIGDAFNEAIESGDQAAMDRAADAVRDEFLSRLESDEAEIAENSSPEPKVPVGTYAYIDEAVNEGQVEQCRVLLDSGRPDDLCELIVLYGEGKIEAGPYTNAEANAVLDEAGSR